MGRGIKNLARTRNNGSRASIYAFRSGATERGESKISREGVEVKIQSF